MFDYWKYKRWCRQIRRQIAEVDKKSAHSFKHAEIQSVAEAVTHYRAERKHLEIKLESLEAARLRKKALNIH